MDLGGGVKAEHVRSRSMPGRMVTGLPICSGISAGLLQWCTMRITASSRIWLVSVLAASALSTGCAFGQARTPGPKSAASASAEAALADFTPDERARILAVQDTVERASSEYGLDPSLINAIIWVESRFEPDAESPAGARGLMQLMPATAAYLAKRLGEPRPRANDPEFNVRAGSLYLSEMVEKFDDERNAVAAYHAGPGNVAKWLAAGKRFPDWSNEYVDKVMAARVRFEGLPRGGSRMASAAAPPSELAIADEVEVADEPSEAPDPDTLPSADEVRRLAAAGELEPELVSTPAPEPEPEPEPPSEPSPAPRVTATLELEDDADGFALVFEAHPEADANPHAGPPPGWPRKSSPPQASKPAATPAAKVAPKPKPAPKPVVAKRDDDETLGIGVLPDL